MSSETTPSTQTASTSGSSVRFGAFLFDRKRRLLRRDDAEIALPPRVLGVLELLVARAGEVVSRQELIDAVWKEAFVTDTSLAEAVSYLRQALGDDSQAPTYIQTVHRRGYRFVAALSEASSPAAIREPAPARPDGVDAERDVSLAVGPVRPSIANELLPWSVAIISVIAALSALWFATSQKPVRLPILSLPIELGPGQQFDTRAPAIAISPTGSMVAWSACRNDSCQLYVRDLESLDSRALQGTEGASAPFFSPDELWIGFFADGKLKKVFVRGGGAATITEASQPFGGAWLPDGIIVFAPSAAGGLMRVDDNGGAVAAMTIPSAASGEISHAYPTPTPDGQGVMFVVRTSPVPAAPGRLALLPQARPGQSNWKVLVDRADMGGAVGSEFLAFVRDGGLSAVRYDPLTQAAAGAPQVFEDPNESALSPQLALSASGAMAIASGRRASPSPPAPPVWEWTLTGHNLADGLTPLYQVALSPDGRYIAGVDRESKTDLWVVDVERGTRVRLTHAGLNANPVWSTDAAAMFYASRQQGPYEIWSRHVNGDEAAKRILAKPDRHLFPSSMSVPGDLAFVESGGASRSDVGIFAAATGVRMIAQTPFDETAPALSPNGAMIAYQSDESSRWEITLVRLSDGKRTVVSRDGGAAPFWSADGRLLFFEQDDTLMSVRVDPSLEGTGAPIVVSRLNGATAVGIAPSGAVLLQRNDPQLRIDSASLTINWIEHLRRTLLPALPSTPR